MGRLRVLFVVNPEQSLFPYLVPLAWALRTAGHDVRVASQPHFAETIVRTGLTAVPVGRDSRLDRRLVAAGMTAEAMQANREGMGPPYDLWARPTEITWDRLVREHREAVTVWHNPENFPMMHGVVEYAQQWRPQLMVREPLSLAGAVAAQVCGAAHVRVLWSVDVFAGLRRLYRENLAAQPRSGRQDPVAEWLDRYCRRYGSQFDETMLSGHLTVDQLPPGLQIHSRDVNYLSMRPVPYGGAAQVPAWLWERPRRPRVAFSMGLSGARLYGGYHVPVGDILQALAGLDIEVVATVAEAEQRRLPPLPANVRVVTYAPLDALAATCDVVVHHAGAATLATVAAAGAAHLCLHHHWDGPILARRLAAIGAGLEMPTSQATGAAVRKAVARLLDESMFRRRAADLARRCRQLPSPNDVVPALESLAGSR